VMLAIWYLQIKEAKEVKLEIQYDAKHQQQI
jgi:hypothetical protein